MTVDKFDFYDDKQMIPKPSIECTSNVWKLHNLSNNFCVIHKPNLQRFR